MDNDATKRVLILKFFKYVWLFALSVVFLLLFSLWTTPLYKGWYGCDASFFTMAGRGICEGWVPYVDFFDLKGPYFFFIEALGQYIVKGRSGAFVVQCVALFAALVIILKLLDKFKGCISTGKRIFIIGIFLFFHIATLWGGNTLEEYMLPLNLICLYMLMPGLPEKKKRIVNTETVDDNSNPDSGVTKMQNDIEIASDVAETVIAEPVETEKPFSFKEMLKTIDILQNITPLTGFVFGVCFGIILFAKVTVGAPIAGLVVAVIVTFIIKKEYKRLIKFLGFSLLGIIAAAAPLFIYFGIHHAIPDMLYSVFIFAFKRSVDFGNTYNIRWELKISGCYFAIIFVLFQLFPKKRREELSEFAIFLLRVTFYMALITAVLLHFGDQFIYYYTTVYPTLIMAFISMFVIYRPFELFKNIHLDIPLVFFLVTLCYFASWSASTLNTVIYDRNNSYYMNYVNQAEEMASLIPEPHRDSVYSFNVDMQWFEITKILPCYSYTINLQFFVALDNRIEEKIIERLNTEPPTWIVVGGDLSTYLPNINDVVCEKYVDIYDNDFASLYLLDEMIVKDE